MPEKGDAFGLLGIAKRAGAVVTGVDSTRRAVHAGEVRLAILAKDASERQLEKVRKVLEHRGVPIRWVADGERLGKALGVGPLSVVGIKTKTFATQFLTAFPTESLDSDVGQSP